MKNAIRCCISCILPCGALDVIRIVHANGHVEEISGSIRAAEIMKLHPKHVLKKPSTPCADSDAVSPTNIVIVPPDAELQRGKIYFLVPLPPPPPPPASSTHPENSTTKKKKKNTTNNKKRKKKKKITDSSNDTHLAGSDRYLSEILSEKVESTQRERRRGRVGVWRPHLESISETSTEA